MSESLPAAATPDAAPPRARMPYPPPFEVVRVSVTCQAELDDALRAGHTAVITNHQAYTLGVVVTGHGARVAVGGESRTAVVVAGPHRAPRIDTAQACAPYITTWGKRDLTIFTWDQSTPRIVTYASSAPHSTTRERPAPHIITVADCAPRIRASEHTAPRIGLTGPDIDAASSWIAGITHGAEGEPR